MNCQKKSNEDLYTLAVFGSSYIDPTTYEEAVEEDVRRKAMDVEITSIEKNDTWELTTLPDGAKNIGVKWVYKTKLNEDGKVEKYKARLVAKGHSQQHGVDYKEVFAPVARWDTIISILAIATIKGWIVFRLDVKSAFLQGELSETVYSEQPQGYQKKDDRDKVYKLKKAMYGLRHVPRAWNSRIEAYVNNEGFEKCSHEHTLFMKHEDGRKLITTSLYIDDDHLFTGNDEAMFVDFKESMKKEFDVDKMRVEVVQTNAGIYICQQKYAKEILERFGMDKCSLVCNLFVPGCKLTKHGEWKLVDPTKYKQIVGSLMYMTAIRPNLMFYVCLISKYMERPTEMHLQIAKRILRFIKVTLEFGIMYKGKEMVI